MRLRTLPVSVAGVIAGTGCAAAMKSFSVIPAIICLFFAILAQIASNFANEYFDFRNGLDKKGREGFRRGVTEGDISPRAMRNATFITLGIDCLLGLSLIIWGGWWLIPVGVLIVLFALAYSTGPYPLSHHGLGDIAVVIFFGLVPVNLTAYVQCQSWEALPLSLPLSFTIGLLAALVLIVNNYRDYEDDLAVGKRTSIVILGRSIAPGLYYGLALTALIIGAATLSLHCSPSISTGHQFIAIGLLIFIIPYTLLWIEMRKRTGAALNPLLGITAMLLLLVSFYLLIVLSIS